MSYTDQREPGFGFQKQNPNWTDQFRTEYKPTKSKYDSEDYKFDNLPSIKDYPVQKADVLDAYNHKENFGHKMDALKYAVDNKIPFVLWNSIVYDWKGNTINCDYWSLK